MSIALPASRLSDRLCTAYEQGQAPSNGPQPQVVPNLLSPEQYRAWKSRTPYIYDLFLNHRTEWPSYGRFMLFSRVYTTIWAHWDCSIHSAKLGGTG